MKKKDQDSSKCHSGVMYPTDNKSNEEKLFYYIEAYEVISIEGRVSL